jgi:hypothetical protein
MRVSIPETIREEPPKKETPHSRYLLRPAVNDAGLMQCVARLRTLTSPPTSCWAICWAGSNPDARGRHIPIGNRQTRV